MASPVPARSNGTAGLGGKQGLIEYLPSIYQEDRLIGQLLRIVEDINFPLERMVDQIAHYMDPRETPAELLPWLASWVGIDIDERWPLARRRELVYWAARLYRWRGTRRGLREHLRVYTGRPPVIVENFDGVRLGSGMSLGPETRLGVRRDHWLSVTLYVDRPDEFQESIARQIIEFQKPVQVGYHLNINWT